MGRPTAKQIVSRQADWEAEVSVKLPVLLSDLLHCQDCADSPPKSHGVYLFSDHGTPMYVGRTGRTERSIAANKVSHSNFASRRRGHITPRHTSGTYAYRLAVAAFAERKKPLAGTREANSQDTEFMAEFRSQCERVKAMEFRVVEITDDKLAAVFEVYAATVLKTKNSWATS